MPSGAKKRKAAKKKQLQTNPNQVIAEENDSGELSSPTPQDPSVEVVKREDGPSELKSKGANNEEEGNIEIETVSKSKSSSSSSSSSSDSSDDEPHVVEKQVVVIESAPVESFPEEISPIVAPVKPVDSLLAEVSQVFDEMKHEEKKGLVVEETPVVEEQQTVDDCETVVKDEGLHSSVVAESVLKENEVEKLQPLVEKTSLESSSTSPKELISDVNGADHANEIVTAEHPDRQALPAPTPIAVQNTTPWKCCCGIFELFSGSGR